MLYLTLLLEPMETDAVEGDGPLIYVINPMETSGWAETRAIMYLEANV